MLEGLDARLDREIEVLREVVHGVHSLPTRRFYAWIGGSKFALLAEFSKKMVSKEHYEENGIDAVVRKIPCTGKELKG